MASAPLLEEILSDAEQRRKKEQWVLAETLYLQAFELAPGDLRILTGLGELYMAVDRPALAESFWSKAVVIHPEHPHYWVQYGLALRQQNKLAGALTAFHNASILVPSALPPVLGAVDCLTLQSRWDEARAVIMSVQSNGVPAAPLYGLLGQALKRAGLYQDAEHAFGAAVACDPDDSVAWQGRAVLRFEQGRFAEALGDASRAVMVAPESGRGWVVQAVVLRACNRLGDAIQAARRAVACQPVLPDALAELGTLLQQAGQGEEALEWLQAAYQMAPQRTDVLYNLAGSLMAAERYSQAAELYHRCQELRPEWRDAQTNYGVCLMRQGFLEDAEAALRRAVSLEGLGSAEARYNLAWCLLLKGQFVEGWQAFEARWELPDFSSPQRLFPVPRWDGSPCDHLFLHAEQGLGDSIQMWQLIACARERVGLITLEVPPALQRLAGSVPGVDQVVLADLSRPHDLPVDCAAHLPLMSLPAVLGLELKDLPRQSCYVLSPPASPAVCLPASDKPKVGFVWAGSPHNKIDRYRSIPWDIFQPLTQSQAIEAWSLQLGAETSLKSCMGQVQDMADTASVLAQLDLIVGVDTAVLHLAAAMGKPTWMLIPFAPDYRWLDHGDGSAWYPTLRLFRQKDQGEWPDVVRRVAAELDLFCLSAANRV